jgi:hypothetical protein
MKSSNPLVSDYSKPVYVLNNREYKSLNGFIKALLKDCGANECSAVRDGKITCSNRIGALTRVVVAEYTVSKPEIGKPMFVERVTS